MLATNRRSFAALRMTIVNGWMLALTESVELRDFWRRILYY
jgi:hypothetical protein